jgi:uncharacterized protein YuzE
MKTERHDFLVTSSAPPTIEVDREATAVYVRFKEGPVAKTVTQPCETMNIAIDLDAKGEVVGIEAVGVTEFSIRSILESASVRAPNTDFSRAQYVPADLVPA